MNKQKDNGMTFKIFQGKTHKDGGSEEVCKTCNGEGYYYEDVVGDGGSRMQIYCDDCNIDEEDED